MQFWIMVEEGQPRAGIQCGTMTQSKVNGVSEVLEPRILSPFCSSSMPSMAQMTLATSAWHLTEQRVHLCACMCGMCTYV